jgi:2-amino-4-hydroxy-6-hydroxymethyldihydropteridine diphosphokinase
VTVAASASWFPAYVALGSNLDDPPARVREALLALARLPATRVEATSRLWRTLPVGPPGQPDYVNACAALLTRLDPETLLAELRALEVALGKVAPATRWGPRRIDLDLLAYADRVHASPSLELPHPRLHERAFVLYPLAEIAADLHVPARGRVAVLRSALEGRLPPGDAPVPL